MYINEELNFTSSELGILKKMLINPEEDVQKLISLIHKREEIQIKKFKEKEQRFRSLIEQTTDAVFCYEFSSPIPIDLSIDEQVKLMYDCILIDCNLICAQSYGADRVEDVIGGKLTDLFGTIPGSLNRLFRNMVESGYQIVDGVGIEKIPGDIDRYYLNNGHGVIENGKLLRIWGTFRDITELKIAEQKLINEKNMAEKYLNLVNVIIVALDREGNITLINKKGNKILEYEEGELIGKNWFKTCLPKNLKNDVFKVFKQLIKGELEPVEFYENPVLTKNGEERIIAWHNALLYDDDGNINGTLGSGNDITERRLTEQKLKESEDELRKLNRTLEKKVKERTEELQLLSSATEQVNDAIIITDNEFKINYVNHAAERLYGYAKNELIGKSPEILNAEILAENIQKEIYNTVGVGDFWNGEIINKDKNERTFLIDTKISPIFDKVGNISSYISINRDITEKRKTEQKLEESKEKFSKAFHSSPNLMSISRLTDGLIMDVNDSFTISLGYTREEAVGQKISELNLWANPKQRSEFIKDIQEDRKIDSIDVDMRTKSGNILNMLFSGDIIYLNNKAHLISIANNITERKKSQKELIELKEFYQNIIESIVDGVWVTDKEDQIYYTNKAMGVIAGIDPEKIIGAHVLRDFPEETLKYFRPKYLEAKESLKPVYYNTLKVVTPAGRESYQSGWLIPMIQNEVSNGIICTVQDITESKHAEQKLKESESKLKSIISAIPDQINIMDKDFNIIFCNDLVEELYGPNVVGNKCYEIFYGFSAVCDNCYVANTLKDGKVGNDECVRINKDGNKHNYWCISNIATVDNNGEPLTVLEISRDITEKKIAEKKLRESEERFRNLNNDLEQKVEERTREKMKEKNKAEMYLNLVNVIIVALDREGSITLINKKGKEILEYEEGELIGKNWFKTCLPPEDGDRVFDYFKQLMNNEIEIIPFYENPIYTKKGEEKLIAWSGKLTKDENDKITGVLSSGEDITERKKAEEELKKFKSISDNANYGAAITDLEGNLTYSNDYFASIHGYKTHELIGYNLSIFHNDNQLERVIELKQKLIEEGSYAVEEVWHTHRDGLVFPMLMNGIIINDNKGNPLFMAATAIDISDRKKAEQKLRESEEKFKMIFVESPIAITLYDSNAKLLDANKACLDLINVPDVEIIKGFDLFNDPNLPSNTREKLFNGEHVKFEIMYDFEKVKDNLKTSKSGTLTFDAIITPIYQADGTISNYLNQVQDITDRKVTEQKLKESEEKYRILFESSPIGIGISNKAGEVITMNKKMEDLTKFTLEEINKLGLEATYVDPNQRSKLQKILNETGMVKDCEIKLKHADGTHYIALLNINRIDLGGEMLIHTNMMDITERRDAEIKLRESEEKIRNLIENISYVLTEANSDGVFTFVSPQIFEIIGSKPDEIIGKNIAKYIHPEDLIIHQKALKKTLDFNSPFSYECRIRHRKGYYIPISVKGSPVIVNNELKLYGVIRDITERRKVDDMIKREIKQLKELDQIRNDLIRRISHELNTPLISILNGSQFLLDSYNDQMINEVLNVVRIIHSGGYRLKELVDNLITAYELETDQIVLKLRRENLIAIIMGGIEKLTFQAEKRKIFINIELPNKINAAVDREIFSKSILNLISNAIKNTPHGGNIFIKSIEHHNFVDIIIKDAGVGLTDKEMPSLFKKFGKIERYGRGMDVDIEGPGLGLYISNEIVKLHKGEILVKSKGRNKGSTFTIRLFLN